MIFFIEQWTPIKKIFQFLISVETIIYSFLFVFLRMIFLTWSCAYKIQSCMYMSQRYVHIYHSWAQLSSNFAHMFECCAHKIKSHSNKTIDISSVLPKRLRSLTYVQFILSVILANKICFNSTYVFFNCYCISMKWYIWIGLHLNIFVSKVSEINIHW